MGLKTIMEVTGELSTTDSVFTTIATCTLPTPTSTNCNILIPKIWAQGRTTNGTVGQSINATAVHRAKRVSTTVSMVGANILFVLTFNTGSDTSLSNPEKAQLGLQIIASGNTLQLQVKGIATRNIDWYGGFKVIIH